MVEEDEKLVASWDKCEIIDKEVRYRIKYWKEDGYYENKPDEDVVREDVCTDYTLFDTLYQYELNNLTKVVMKLSPKGKWKAKAENIGWQRREGTADFEDISNGEKFINKCVGNAADYSWWVWKNGNELRVRVTHHDAPTGEFYSWIPSNPWYESMPITA